MKRPTHQSTQHAKDQYEVCNQKYTVIEDGGHGVAVLNDGTFGVNVKESCIGLSLLRAPVLPDMTADQGIHRITYACYVYEGAFAQSNVVRQGYELNLNVTEYEQRDNCYEDVKEFEEFKECEERRKEQTEIPMLRQNTNNPNKKSYFQIDKPNIILETCKPSMYGRNAVVLRLYECMGMATECKIAVPKQVKMVYECNMLEREEKKQGPMLKFHPFEIKTLLLEV